MWIQKFAQPPLIENQHARGERRPAKSLLLSVHDAVMRERLHVIFWRIVNPPTRPLAGLVPWWVLLETTGRTSGRKHRVPLATGPSDPAGMWLISVHGRHAAWVRNIEASAAVRIRVRRHWRVAKATVHPMDPEIAAKFNRYARSGPRVMGVDPAMVRVNW